jgi:hypothetical protein
MLLLPRTALATVFDGEAKFCFLQLLCASYEKIGPETINVARKHHNDVCELINQSSILIDSPAWFERMAGENAFSL